MDRFGFSSSVCVSSRQDWAALIVDADRDAYERAVSALEAGKSDRYLLEYRIRAPGGGTIRLVDEGVAEASADGRGRLVRRRKRRPGRRSSRSTTPRSSCGAPARGRQP